MKKFIIITLIFASTSFFLGKVIWPETKNIDIILSSVISPGTSPLAVEVQLFLFALLTIIESISFGIGMAFAILGWKYIKNLPPENKKEMVAAFLSVVWVLISWWPHDNMHRINSHSNLGGLLKIEYLFHFTIIVAGCIFAYTFWKTLSNKKTA